MNTLRLIFTCLMMTLCAGASELDGLPIKPPKDWQLCLSLGGAPWEVRFRVRIDQTGELSVEKLDPKAKEAGFQAIFSGKLPPEDAGGIYEAAAKSLQSFRFPQQPNDLADGTSVAVGLTIYKRTVTMTFGGLQDARKASPEIARILDAINKRLPEKSKIW